MNLPPLYQLAGVAPARVGERTRHTQANRQKRHDEHCTHKPAEHIDRVEGAHVIHRAIQIQARHHNDNRWHREGDARYVSLISARLASSPDTSAPINAAASGGIPALRPRKGSIVGASTSVRRKVLDTAPISPAAAAIFTGLLNITEKPNTPIKLISMRKSVRANGERPSGQNHPVSAPHIRQPSNLRGSPSQ